MYLPKLNFEYGYPHSNAILQFRIKMERCKQHKAALHPKKCDVINDIKLYPTVYRRIILLQIFDVIQSNVALQKQEH